MTSTLTRRLAAAALATALGAALGAAAPATAQVQPLPQGPAGNVLTSGLPDIIATTIGFVMKSGPVQWGNSVDLLPHQADATQVGRRKNLCRFHPAAYRTFNKGDGNAGPFVNKTYVDGVLAHTHNVPGGLPAKQGIDWHQFTLDLKEGMNVVRVIFDADKQVAESDENNTFHIRVNVNIDCDGDGKIGGVPLPSGGIRQAPGASDPDPAPTRRLRLKSAN